MPNLSLEAQRTRLLAYLQAVGSDGCTTIQARELLDIIAPAPRICELRHHSGYNIKTIWQVDVNAQGNKHRVARYLLMPGIWQGK